MRDTARLLVKEGAAELIRRGVGVGVAGGADPRIQVVRRSRAEGGGCCSVLPHDSVWPLAEVDHLSGGDNNLAGE